MQIAEGRLFLIALVIFNVNCKQTVKTVEIDSLPIYSGSYDVTTFSVKDPPADQLTFKVELRDRSLLIQEFYGEYLESRGWNKCLLENQKWVSMSKKTSKGIVDFTQKLDFFVRTQSLELALVSSRYNAESRDILRGLVILYRIDSIEDLATYAKLLSADCHL